MGEAISQEGFKGLAKYGDKCTAELNKIVSLVRGQLTSLERATCGALVTIDVHARDITVQVGSSIILLLNEYWQNHTQHLSYYDNLFSEHTVHSMHDQLVAVHCHTTSAMQQSM